MKDPLVVTVISALVIAAITGGISVWGNSLVIENKLEHVKDDVARLSNKLDLWYSEHQALKYHYHNGKGQLILPPIYEDDLEESRQ